MTIIYGQCGCCEHIGEYKPEDMKRVGMVACKKCTSKSVWRIYTNAELDKMREGERVE